MLSPSVRSRRRTAVQLAAVLRLQRELNATDANGRLKYLRDFVSAYREYQSVLSPEQLDAALSAADVLLVADYHALPKSQAGAADLIARLAEKRPVVLGVEFVFARDQHILDAWFRREIDDSELRERIRFDADWGYDWAPFLHVLEAARAHGAGAYGLDCGPRDDMRKITARDRHAAGKIAEVRARHPEAALVVLFGESHLAPNHLPAQLRALAPRERVLTVLQNVDALYWKAAGEKRDHVAAVRVVDDVVCLFNATPLEKYESYRLCIERWRQERPAALDLAPSVYNLIDALTGFLHIDKYAPSNGTQPKYLVDELPEIHHRPESEAMRRLLTRQGFGPERAGALLEEIERRGLIYLPEVNGLFLARFEMLFAAEEAARFLHLTCRGERHEAVGDRAAQPDDLFYQRVLEIALADFGSRVLHPTRAPVRETDLFALYAQPREAVESAALYSYREHMQLIDFLVLHKDFEANARYYAFQPPQLTEGPALAGEKFAFVTEWLGKLLGSQLYDGYVAGRVSKRFLRALFCRKLLPEGAARRTYFDAARKLRPARRLRLVA